MPVASRKLAGLMQPGQGKGMGHTRLGRPGRMAQGEQAGECTCPRVGGHLTPLLQGSAHLLKGRYLLMRLVGDTGWLLERDSPGPSSSPCKDTNPIMGPHLQDLL